MQNSHRERFSVSFLVKCHITEGSIVISWFIFPRTFWYKCDMTSMANFAKLFSCYHIKLSQQLHTHTSRNTHTRDRKFIIPFSRNMSGCLDLVISCNSFVISEMMLSHYQREVEEYIHHAQKLISRCQKLSNMLGIRGT